MEEFGQKAKQSFKMGLDFLQKKAQQTVDLTKLQGQLSKAQENKQQALITLGERVCVMFDMDTFKAEELKDGVEQVREFAQQIADLTRQIQDVRNADHKAEPKREQEAEDGPADEPPAG